MELFKTVFTYVMTIILFLQLLRIRNNIKIKTKPCLYTAVHASFTIDISGTNITGEAQNGTLHALETLNLEGSRLTDIGLLQTIRQRGGTIQSLNINRTNITGVPLWDYDRSLLCI